MIEARKKKEWSRWHDIARRPLGGWVEWSGVVLIALNSIYTPGWCCRPLLLSRSSLQSDRCTRIWIQYNMMLHNTPHMAIEYVLDGTLHILILTVLNSPCQIHEIQLAILDNLFAFTIALLHHDFHGEDTVTSRRVFVHECCCCLPSGHGCKQ